MARTEKTDLASKLHTLKKKYAFRDDKKYLEGLDKLISSEATKLEKEGYFEDKGEFWLIFETRDYMLLLYEKFIHLRDTGRYGRALKLAEEMIELSNNDSLGMRFRLAGLYAYFEDEKILQLQEKSMNTLLETFPLAIYYYKIGEDKKCKALIRKIKKDFPNLSEEIMLIMNNYEDYVGQAMYSPGSFTEVVELVNNNYYLFANTVAFITSI